MHALAFHNTQFDITDRNGQPWLRSFQIGSALGYKNPSADMAKLYDRNADEFTSSMTALVELDTAGGKQQVRIFSLRGVHLLAMLSRTKVAKEFRHWVLDVLEGIAEVPAAAKAKRQPKALPNGLSLDQQATIKGLVKARVEALPQNKQAKAAVACWSALKSKFGCTYKQIEPAQFAEALSLVARLPLEGELLEAEQPKSLELHYPVSWLPEHNPHLRGYSYERSADPSLHLNTSSLCGMDARSPSLALIGELTRAGYDVEACRVELLAMRHQLERYGDLCNNLATLADRHQHGGIVFKLTGQAQAIR